ncbi:monovalent cation/H(+) antiporter subunit G [Listeria monocytogenes]|uniref:Cation:proton antiporter n=2 Tax=Listeria monocytogenes TaxID=1639 RepID=A0A2Z5C2B6_LISMN|nr:MULTISPECIES: monovalent cation/H(+) antiporter subunit G [Listeria]EAE1680870.1 Na+/H+ antiporter subunit G [Listeria monocytogenes LIS0071]EAE3706738.1 Na+/H+ antiporter subunit G [Listeria monocytogenes serotype 1/2b]EAF3078261.1 Na+/H+ antiporter subunit G [Listeria monocytogenes serotype 1/2a]EAG6254160.1 Na+/H+ antiporter subunit G [Listeria monocytogenes CFSAN003806]EAG6263079.1 Na+/H+ antiporter subunit G [Listeria monocytogenes CFSAN003725]EAG6333117.1 Na+/H+ antiporter subunit G 
MNVIIEIIISIMILIGGLLSILAAIGVIRLPDVYTRTHAAGISNTFGVSLLLFATVGYFFHSGEGFNARVLLAVLFIFLTTPVASHLINRAAYDTGVPLAIRIRDQLRSVKKDDIKKKKNLIIRQEQIEKARQEREELEERMEWERREEKIDEREDQEEQEREREEQTIEEQSDDSEHEIIEQDESETESDDDKTEK